MLELIFNYMKIFIIALLAICFFNKAKCQLKLSQNSGISFPIKSPDTMRGIFMEIDTTVSPCSTKFTKGYIILKNGYIIYYSTLFKDNTIWVSAQSSPDYLPFAMGLIKNKMYYNDSTEVKSPVIKIIRL